MEIVQMIGFWSGGEGGSPSWVHPSTLVVPGCYGDEKASVVSYLRAGHRIRLWRGLSFCRFEGGPSDREMGHCDLTDGTWAWPEGLWIYVDRYDVRLPEEFLAHVRSCGYLVPESAFKLTAKSVEYDFFFWNMWSEDQRASAKDST